jgi:hypothetical protein
MAIYVISVSTFAILRRIDENKGLWILFGVITAFLAGWLRQVGVWSITLDIVPFSLAISLLYSAYCESQKAFPLSRANREGQIWPLYAAIALSSAISSLVISSFHGSRDPRGSSLLRLAARLDVRIPLSVLQHLLNHLRTDLPSALNPPSLSYPLPYSHISLYIHRISLRSPPRGK